MIIHGLQKLTLLDYPGQTACTVFTGGCNLRCPFCHNATLVLDPESQPVIPAQEVLDLLDKRAGILDGMAVTGGEPLLQPGLMDFLAQVRERGVLIKLDTNGTLPEHLQRILEAGLCDYVAMDIKAGPSNYPAVVGRPGFDVAPVRESVELLKAGGWTSSGTGKPIDHEFRTTVVDELHSAQDFQEIGEWIAGAPHYFLQAYKDSGDILATATSSGADYHAPSDETLKTYLSLVQEWIPNAQVRGVDL